MRNNLNTLYTNNSTLFKLPSGFLNYLFINLYPYKTMNGHRAQPHLTTQVGCYVTNYSDKGSLNTNQLFSVDSTCNVIYCFGTKTWNRKKNLKQGLKKYEKSCINPPSYQFCTWLSLVMWPQYPAPCYIVCTILMSD